VGERKGGGKKRHVMGRQRGRGGERKTGKEESTFNSKVQKQHLKDGPPGRRTRGKKETHKARTEACKRAGKGR